ncbi:hypothetical protein HID58_027293, partial [Brassica napus]
SLNPSTQQSLPPSFSDDLVPISSQNRMLIGLQLIFIDEKIFNFDSLSLNLVWVARRPPGYAFLDFEDSRDDRDAIRDLDGKNGWRVEQSHNRGGGEGHGGGRGGGDGGRGSVSVARRPPGYAFLDLEDSRDARDAIRDLDGKNGWRVEQSHNRGGGRGGGDGGRGRGGSDLKCYECGESGHFACECRSCGGGGGFRRGRSPSPRGRSRSRSPPRYRKSPTYGGHRFFVI